MNYHPEIRVPRECTVCRYKHPRQDQVTSHMRRVHGIMPSPKVAKQRGKRSGSVTPSISDPVIVLDSPVKLKSKAPVKAKSTMQTIIEYQEKHKGRIETYQKYRNIRRIKLHDTAAGLPDDISQLKDTIMELGVHVGHFRKNSRGGTDQGSQ